MLKVGAAERAAGDQRLRGGPLVGHRGGGGDAAVGAVGGDEVDQRFGVLQLAPKSSQLV